MAANYKSMIKSAFSNKVHKLLNPENKKTNEIMYSLTYMTDVEKVEMFDRLLLEYQKSTTELRNAMKERRFRNKVNRLRKEKAEKLSESLSAFATSAYSQVKSEQEKKEV